MSAFIDAHRDRFGVEPLCREIEVSASAYRARRTRPPSARAQRDAHLLTEIRRVHADSGGVYGQLKVWDELRDQGVSVARCTAERLMRAHGLAGVSCAHDDQIVCVRGEAGLGARRCADVSHATADRDPPARTCTERVSSLTL